MKKKIAIMLTVILCSSFNVSAYSNPTSNVYPSVESTSNFTKENSDETKRITLPKTSSASTYNETLSYIKSFFNKDGSLSKKATRKAIKTAKTKTEKIKTKSQKTYLNDLITKAEKKLTKMENAAKNAVAGVWNAKKGILISGTSSSKIENASIIVGKLPEGDVKTQLKTYIKKAKTALNNQQKRAKAKSSAPALDGRMGTAGRLYIPDLKISVALFDYNYNLNAQKLVDDYDSAAFFSHKILGKNDPIIADHSNQGFYKIREAVIGSTKAYIYDTYGNLSEYVCINRFDGHNCETHLSDLNYNDVSSLGNDLIMYTCNESWQNITITIWECTAGIIMKRN